MKNFEPTLTDEEMYLILTALETDYKVLNNSKLAVQVIMSDIEATKTIEMINTTQTKIDALIMKLAQFTLDSIEQK